MSPRGGFLTHVRRRLSCLNQRKEKKNKANTQSDLNTVTSIQYSINTLSPSLTAIAPSLNSSFSFLLLLPSAPAPFFSSCSFLQLLLLPSAPAPSFSSCSFLQLLLLPSAPAPSFSSCSFLQLLLFHSAPAPSGVDHYVRRVFANCLAEKMPFSFSSCSAPSFGYCSLPKLLLHPSALITQQGNYTLQKRIGLSVD